MAENRSITIVIILLISLSLGAFLVWPKYQEYASLEEEVKTKTVEFQSKDSYYSDLKKIKEELDGYKNEISKIDSALPGASPLSSPEILDFLQKASSQAGMILGSISPVSVSSSSGEETSEIKKSQVSLSLVGEYASFKKFLSILEKSARLVDVESISFSSPKEGSFTFNLTVAVSSY